MGDKRKQVLLVEDEVFVAMSLAGGMDGVDASGVIRTFSAVPIVFMTGYADRENERAITDVQPLGFLVKPISFSRLQTLLESL